MARKLYSHDTDNITVIQSVATAKLRFYLNCFRASGWPGRLPRMAGSLSPNERSDVPQSLKKRAAELERQVKEYAENVKRVLREYRETQRASARLDQAPPARVRARLLRKRRDVERANAEYMALQKELDSIRSRMQARK